MTPAAEEEAWSQAVHAAAIFAVAPQATGLVVRGGPGPARDALLRTIQELLPLDAAFKRVPSGVADDRLLGGLDLAMSLKTGRPVVAPGLLAEADGGVLVLTMAERIAATTAARIAAATDDGEVRLARDGVIRRLPCHVGLIALDEGREADERPPEALLDRLALDLQTDGLRCGDYQEITRETVAAARRRLPDIGTSDQAVEALVQLAAAFGIASLRAPLHALHVARIIAALRGAAAVADEDLAVAVRLVLVPRATCLPAPLDEDGAEEDEPDDAVEDREPAEPATEGEAPDAPRTEAGDEVPQDGNADLILAAALASLPAGVLARLRARDERQTRGERTGRAGPTQARGRRGRPAGTRAGDPPTARLAILDTLRAAAPWQKIRARHATGGNGRLLIRPDDFRVRQHRPRQETSAIFVVDASGSAAVHRLGEVKGAIELLLAECYVRRDSVALIAFRGTTAEIVLPPTRSLARARRLLAGVPGGGGTPIAAGLDTALELAHSLRRKGCSPFIVLLTDGRANVARGGRLGRPQALADAIDAARHVNAAGFAAIAIDTAPLIQSDAGSSTAKIGTAMGARYIRLPQADAARLSNAVRAAAPVG